MNTAINAKIIIINAIKYADILAITRATVVIIKQGKHKNKANKLWSFFCFRCDLVKAVFTHATIKATSA